MWLKDNWFKVALILVFVGAGVATIILINQRNQILEQTRIEAAQRNEQAKTQASSDHQQCLDDAKNILVQNVSIRCAATSKTETDKQGCYASTFDETLAYTKYVKSIDPIDPYSRMLDVYEADTAKCN